MNQNKELLEQWSQIDCDTVDFDELENKLESELEEQMADLTDLEKDREKIGNPDSLGKVVADVVWDQFINQIGAMAGEDFIKNNRGLTLDLSDDAHIQTTSNFEKGKTAKHNRTYDYQKRYEDWRSNFVLDENGNVVTKYDRIDNEYKPVLKEGYRKPYDKGRNKGSKTLNNDEDVPVAEQARSAAANAHMSLEERVAFDQSEVNTNPMDNRANESKGDHKATNWLESERDGKKPAERFPIDEEQIREKDKEARRVLDEKIEENKEKGKKAGKESQKAEAKEAASSALKGILLSMLAELAKSIIIKLIKWLKDTGRSIKNLLEKLKEAIHDFVSKLKQLLFSAGNSLVSTIATAIWGPFVGMIKKAMIFLKQGYKSLKEAISFMKDPANKNMPFSVKLMQVGKIVIVGLTAGGAIVLSEVIEKGLMTIPGFAFEIPLLGSLANIIGIFLGAVVSGIIGALALNLIDKAIANRTKIENDRQQLEKKNSIIQTQEQLIEVAGAQVKNAKVQVVTNIAKRHIEASETFNQTIGNIQQNVKEADQLHDATSSTNDDISDLLDSF